MARAWQEEARARLWHLDRNLFTRAGAATQCVHGTLNALITHYQDLPEEALPSATAPLSPDPADPPSEEAALVSPEVGALPPLNFLEGESPLMPVVTVWASLPVAWPDLRLLLEILTHQVRAALLARGADPAWLGRTPDILIRMVATVAEQRIAQSDHALATHQEESIVTQHLAGRFLANTSHELRTPLTAVLGFSELLLEETYGPLTPEQRTAVNHIENSAQNLLEIVNNLLDLLHIRAGQLTLQYRLVAIAPLLQNLYTILTPLAQRKDVRFTLELPDDLGTIEADENILRHIVYYLLASSIRATPAEGEVTVQVERMEAALVLYAHDTALHLPPEAVANMMDPFPRLENSPARGYEGWEVGLPLVRRYIDMHGGTLEMQSLPEQGTTFRVVLPTTRATKPEQT